jgi:phosphocarrier protein HPr
MKAVVTIEHPTGLHARPAVAFTRLAKSFDALLRIRRVPDGGWVDAKSMVKVMGMKLRTGSLVEIKGEGSGGEAGVAALVALIERNFDE